MLKLSRPSPALVVATIALFVAAGGGAWAATKNANSALYARATAHPKASIASRGPRGPRGFRGFRGVRGATGGRGAQGPAGPSDGFIARATQQQGLTTDTDTKIVQLSLTVGGTYIVTATTELAGNAGGTNEVGCDLLQNANPVGHGSANLPQFAAFSATVAITGAVDTNNGANVSVSCNPQGLGFARNAVITAVRVGTLHNATP